MSKRNYNVFFHTHTVSGIIISVVLFIIFFAGAFALFKDEIRNWQKGSFLSYEERSNIDFDKIIKKLDNEYDLRGRDIQINFNKEDDYISTFLTESKDSTASDKAKKNQYLFIDIHNNEHLTYKQNYDIGEFLYRLHFLSQIPSLGMYLTGFVALFFLFAIITGIIVHWKKIISNFYQFNPKIALKRVWTDAHTALGVLGLPFQFVYAVTGAYMSLSILALIPAVMLYGGDQNKLIEKILPERKNYEWLGSSDEKILSYNEFAKKAKNHWDGVHLTTGFIKNYGGKNMKYVFSGELDTKTRLVGGSSLTYDAHSGKLEAFKDPYKLGYLQDTQKLMGRLHFGEFGGKAMKVVYFILAFITCFVIITGVLIWVEARNKKSKTLKQRLYTTKIGHIYLAICLTMLPVTALSFLFVKFTENIFLEKAMPINAFYFITWLVFIVYFRFKRDNYLTNKTNLLLGAIFGFMVPISSGIISGNWIWVTAINHQYDILLVDILWIVLAALSLVFYLKINPSIKSQSTYNKLTINYTGIKEQLKEEKIQIVSSSTSEPEFEYNQKL